MNLLSDADIISMRADLEQSLPETCVIQAVTFTDDSGGGGTATWTAAGTVDCRVAPISGDERERGERVAEDARWIITLPAETSITPAHRIAISGGGTFNVAALHAPRSYELSRRVEAVEIT